MSEKLKRAQSLFDQAKAITENPEATEAERASVPGLLEEARRLKSEIKLLGEIDAEARALVAEAPRSTAAAPEWKMFGEFLEAAHARTTGMGNDARLRVWRDEAEPGTHTRGQKDMSGGSGASGGFLIPEEFRAELYAVMAEQAIVRRRATVLPMRRRTLNIPALEQNGSVSSGQPRWFGGMQFYWLEEAQQKVASDAAFREVSLTAKKLVGYTRSSDELLDDAAISLESFLSGPMGFGGGAAWMEDYAFLRGTGGGQPLGVLNAPATISVTRATANQVNYADLIGMMAKLLPSANAVWLVSQSAMAQLLGMTGPSGNASYLWGSAMSGVPNTLLGLPIIFTEKLPALGTAGDVLLADFRYYLIGDRQAFTVESTKFDRWAYDQTSWRMVHRVDGQPWLDEPLTYADASTVSPFVMLGAAA